MTSKDKSVFGSYFAEHKFPLQAFRPYTFQLESKQFDTFLILLDASGQKRLLQNDDGARGNKGMSRFTVTPQKTANYVIRVTSKHARETGS